jgi:RNA polymerase sigma-70 factor (sigma-E family)
MEVTRIDPSAPRQGSIRPEIADRLGALYQSQGSGATRLAYFLTGDANLAQDITQEAFTRVGRKLFGLRDPEHSRAYLFRTVVNLCRGRARRQARERVALERLRSHPPQAHEEPAGRDEVWDALLDLPIRQRTVIFLRYYQDLSEAQTAEALGCTVGAVKSLMNRGMTTLRARLGEATDV